MLIVIIGSLLLARRMPVRLFATTSFLQLFIAGSLVAPISRTGR
jgi:hypothetical protein